MKFNIALVSLLLSMISLNVYAEQKSSHSAHSAAHQQLLANHGNKLDKTVINDLIKNDIAAREHISANIKGVSAETSMLLNDLLKEANKHIGKKYVWATRGPNTFDCSGFTSYVYKQFGFAISPSSRHQYTQGVAVDKKNLRKGDLVFFTSRNSGGNVGHVGMVVDANNENGTFTFIHASIKGVKISNSDENYYKARYVGAKRIITE